MNTDTNPGLLKFPLSLPNDLDGSVLYYRAKFPPVVAYYEEIVPKIAFDAQAFRDYGNWARGELGQAFEKIKHDYENGDQGSLEFLLQIDERFQKMYCYRFWIVNYLLPDGPIHDYFVTNLRNLIRKLIDVGDSVEDFEQRVEAIQRDLLQGDYSDLYLQQALSGVKLYEQLKSQPELSGLLAEAEGLIDDHNNQDVQRINTIWDEVFTKVTGEGYDELKQSLAIPLEQSQMRSSRQPFYNMLTHTVEFRDDNIRLAERQRNMVSVIEGHKELARSRLDEDEFKLFELSYTQAQNFTEFKDIMGSIDTQLLPLWFGLHGKIRDILKPDNPNMVDRPTGPPAVNQHYVWYLPDHLKARVMTPDFEVFDLERI